MLVIYSDMRQATTALNLEGLSVTDMNSALIKVGRDRPYLQGVDVYICGVDAAGKDASYWERLPQFWAAYFQKAGASIKDYSVLRDTPTLGNH